MDGASAATAQAATFYTLIDSPVGRLMLIGGENGLEQLHIETADRALEVPEDATEDHGRFEDVITQLETYFAGDLREFNLKLNPHGTDFQQRAWAELRKIPYGQTISYGEQARRLGDPNASRAVGGANGANPISIIIPCHRVIGSTGKLTGFGSGLPVKEWLLQHEAGLFSPTGRA